ncbi:MAG: DNA starvation/stationary phase protection protein [Hungatella sp.]|jgi:starvation-inducible DNA-binding protein|nr:DNA starvation/stationary phase protection protein [Hungatella sp.]
MSKNLFEKLNEYLANQQVMYIKLHNLHWYVKGRSFFTLHAKLEELYDQTAQIMDEVAERLLALGGSPVASLKKALALTSVKELEDVPISSDETINSLISDVEYWIRDTKEIVKLAEDNDDGATADQFNGYLAEYQKLLWMLKSYISK